MMRAFIVAVTFAGVLALNGSAATAKPKLKGLKTQAISISARPITSFGTARKPGRAAGKLMWLGGLRLSSPSSYFGGFSGLTISPDGTRIFAASDAGFWMTANLTVRDGVPVDLTDGRIGPFRALSGRVLAKNKEVDAEAVSLAKGTLDNGELLVAFERIHRIGRFPVRNGEIAKPSRYLKLPSYIKGLHRNRGLEGMELLKGRNAGAIVVFAEGRRNFDGNLRGWLMGKGKTREIFLKPINGFDITGIAALPDGGFLALERRFRWSEGVKMRIRRIHADELAAGRVLQGEVLLDV
ncbi:MAG: esterase-like activity of phytase family protein, partial [Hyphomicrobiaceae bacterium]